MMDFFFESEKACIFAPTLKVEKAEQISREVHILILITILYMDISKIFKSEIHLIIMEISEKEVTDKF